MTGAFELVCRSSEEKKEKNNCASCLSESFAHKGQNSTPGECLPFFFSPPFGEMNRRLGHQTFLAPSISHSGKPIAAPSHEPYNEI